jgi:hypothetical protein
VQILKNSLEYIKGELNLQEMVITKWPPAPEVLPTPSPTFPHLPPRRAWGRHAGALTLGDTAHAIGPEPCPSLHMASRAVSRHRVLHSACCFTRARPLFSRARAPLWQMEATCKNLQPATPGKPACIFGE